MKWTSIFIVLLISMVIGKSCKKISFQEEPANNPEHVFQNLWEDFQKHYAVFEERGVNWEALYSQYRPKMTAGTSEQALYEIVTDMLSKLNDAHVNVTTPNRKVFNANRILNNKIDDSLFNLSVIKEKYLKSKFTEDGEASVYTYGLIDNTIYVHFRSINAGFSVLPKVLQRYPNAQGLIVDLRHNPGGDFTYAFPVLSPLIKQKTLVFSSRTKNGPDKNDFTLWYPWYIEPAGTYFSKKVVLLTDRYTVSAAERTVLAFKTIPNVTIIGEPTSGALSTMIGRELANGWYYTLSTQQVKSFDGDLYEGKGIPPHIPIKNTAQEINAGKDRVLETALLQF